MYVGDRDNLAVMSIGFMLPNEDDAVNTPSPHCPVCHRLSPSFAVTLSQRHHTAYALLWIITNC